MENQTDRLLTRKELADRWELSIRTIDRLRENGLLPWTDLACGQGARPIVRIRERDADAIEAGNRKAIA